MQVWHSHLTMTEGQIIMFKSLQSEQCPHQVYTAFNSYVFCRSSAILPVRTISVAQLPILVRGCGKPLIIAGVWCDVMIINTLFSPHYSVSSGHYTAYAFSPKSGETHTHYIHSVHSFHTHYNITLSTHTIITLSTHTIILLFPRTYVYTQRVAQKSRQFSSMDAVTTSHGKTPKDPLIKELFV